MEVEDHEALCRRIVIRALRRAEALASGHGPHMEWVHVFFNIVQAATITLPLLSLAAGLFSLIDGSLRP